jgi:imidazolonepropionase-like amidohydrolase
VAFSARRVPPSGKAAAASNLLILVLALACIVTRAQERPVTVVTGATLIDGTTRPAIPDAVIIIDNGRIREAGASRSVAVPTGATVIDGQGKFIIPGLADMHHHLLSGSMQPLPNRPLVLRRMLAVGVTTVFTPSIRQQDFAALKTASAADAAPYARFFGTGPSITVKEDFFGRAEGAAAPETPAEAQAVVRELKAAGVHAIKIMRDDMSWARKDRVPLMKPEVLSALIEEAHRQQLKVFAHAPMLDAAKEVLRAGGDGLMHGIIDKPVDQEFLTLMKRNRASYVPTMGLYEDIADVAAWARRQAVNWDKAALQPPRLYDGFTTSAGVMQFESSFNNAAFTRERLPVQRANVKAVFDAGIPIVLGTDTGFFGVLVGVATQIELELMVDAGLKPEDALRAATINAARMLGNEPSLGTIESGKAADFVILDADPRADIRNVARINRTFKGGVAYDPVDPAKPVRQPIRGFNPGAARP